MCHVASQMWWQASRVLLALCVISAADGLSDDTQLYALARYVPTSVVRSHTLATVAGGWREACTRVQVPGGDVRNPLSRWWLPQELPGQLPRWLKHHFLLDNTHDFEPQLFATAQREEHSQALRHPGNGLRHSAFVVMECQVILQAFCSCSFESLLCWMLVTLPSVHARSDIRGP